jgi:acetyl-CoA C-acetyltransferase
MTQSTARDVVIVEAVRSPIGKKNGSLSGFHAIDLLGSVLRQLLDRSGVDPAQVGQVVGGCVGQVGMQSMNVTRNAWLASGLPMTVPSTTVDTQCGSSQQAVNLACSLIASGVVDVAVGCGVEVMSRVPMGSTTPRDPQVGKAINRHYWEHFEFTTQFEAAERLAEKWGISRSDCDEFAKLSQDRAAAAWAGGRFASQIAGIEVPQGPADGGGPGESRTFAADEAMRATTLQGLASLRPTGRPDGVHTAGSSSQIADGAAAVLLMTRQHAEGLGLDPLATIVDGCLVGVDPTIMLEGPIPATQRLLSQNGLVVSDLDLVEINEAFAAVVLRFVKDMGLDMEKVNVNGGAIAMGHPLGATGGMILGTLVDELHRTGGRYGLATLCVGGGMGIATVVEAL